MFWIFLTHNVFVLFLLTMYFLLTIHLFNFYSMYFFNFYSTYIFLISTYNVTNNKQISAVRMDTECEAQNNPCV